MLISSLVQLALNPRELALAAAPSRPGLP
eukprot:COSAG01_NODE_73178_length_251_cov_0.513158_1_plen_28_part_10